MLEDAKYMTANDTQTRMMRMLVWGILGVVFIFFTSVSGCVMYSNSVEAEQTRAETEQIKEKAKISKMKFDAIETLIDKGTNPIAARCAIMGYKVLVTHSQIINPCLRFLNVDIKQGEKLQ